MRIGAGEPPAPQRARCPRSSGQDGRATTRGQKNLDWCWWGELNPHAGWAAIPNAAYAQMEGGEV